MTVAATTIKPGLVTFSAADCEDQLIVYSGYVRCRDRSQGSVSLGPRDDVARRFDLPPLDYSPDVSTQQSLTADR